MRAYKINIIMADLRKEVLRKTIHLFELPVVFGYVWVLNNYSQKTAILAVTFLLLIVIKIEYFRINFQGKFKHDFFDFVTKSILRKHERDNLVGSTFFIIATIISFSAFQYKIALAAMLMTVFGDLVASLTGSAYGKKKIFKEKSYVGTGCGLIANIIVGVVIFPQQLFLALIMAGTASFVEMINHKLDDNLTVPLFAGFIGELVVFFMHELL